MELTQNTVEVQSNMQFDETFKVGIADDDAAVSMVIERLISAYKNPYRAALREYTSNAYDEHVEAGVKRPVEVSLPSALSPVLKVQDFGRGLTRDGLKGFGTIGISSKRDSNLLTGGFGMGSKCALAAAPQFTVVSVRDGKRNTVVVARDENNVPHMNFLAETETTDESGTTVIIPISDISKFGDLTNFWNAWAPGTLLVDDEQPKKSIFNPDQFRTIAGGKGYYDLTNTPSGRDDIRVVINQVYYELEYKDLGLDYKQWNILKYYIVRLDNGSVEIAPSRETLLYNAKTKAAVDERMQSLLMLARDDYMKMVNEAISEREAMLAVDKMRAAGYPTEGAKWKNKALILPGAWIQGNQVPNPEGTWASPSHAYNTKSGWMVEKTYSTLGSNTPWRTNPNSNKFVIIHSAGPATHYGNSYRRAHREAFGVNDWLTTMTDARHYGWDIFITSTPVEKINKLYKAFASVILHADEFNAITAKIRSDRAKQEKLAIAEKRKDYKLRVVTHSSSGRASIDEYTADRLGVDYEKVIILRNLEGGFNQRMRESLTTKTGYDRQYTNTGMSLAREGKAAIIVVNKNDKIEDLLPIMPPVTTFEELAVARVMGTYKASSKIERMALRDRGALSLSSITSISDDWLAKIKRKPTREWAKAVQEYRDNGAATRDTVSWMDYHFPKLKVALAIAKGEDKNTLPESPFHRYPLLKAVSGHSVEAAHIVSYINMMDKAAKA